MNTFNRRQLRFRAWFEKISQMAHMDDAILPNWDSPFLAELIYRHNNVRSADKDNVIVMQSTGLTDRKGVEVYEGDILVHKGQSSWLVEYNSQECRFEQFYESSAGTERSALDLGLRLGYCVGGNIFENPELLNKPKEEENGKRAN